MDDNQFFAMELFGERLKRLRQKQRLTQTGLALRAGIANNCVSNYERSVCEPSVTNLCALADVFGVSMDYLWRGKQ